jgi:hypothetical protein
VTIEKTIRGCIGCPLSFLAFDLCWLYACLVCRMDVSSPKDTTSSLEPLEAKTLFNLNPIRLDSPGNILQNINTYPGKPQNLKRWPLKLHVSCQTGIHIHILVRVSHVTCRMSTLAEVADFLHVPVTMSQFRKWTIHIEIRTDFVMATTRTTHHNNNHGDHKNYGL